MATVTRKTPPIGAYGAYKLKQPWVTAVGQNYRCTALLRLEHFTKTDRNVFELIYAPMGLSQDVFTADQQADVIIVDLLATNGDRIYVPDTYIDSYPDQSSIVYNYTVLSIDIGPQPSTIDLSTCLSDVKDVVSKYTGIDSKNITTDVHTAISNTSMTQEQYIAARNAQINALATIQTKDQQIAQLQKTIQSQNSVINQLTAK